MANTTIKQDQKKLMDAAWRIAKGEAKDYGDSPTAHLQAALRKVWASLGSCNKKAATVAAS